MLLPALRLQGVHSALMRLRGMLRMMRALPRLSVAGILERVAAAAELRQQLQLFVAVHLSTAGAAGTVPDTAAAAPAAAKVTPSKGGQGDGSSPRVLRSTTAAVNGAGATPSKRLGGSAACTADGCSSDPVLRAFAAAVGEVLRQQVAALQALECERSAAWVRSLQVAGKPGKQVHRRGLTLLQVALHTGRRVLCIPCSISASLFAVVPARSRNAGVVRSVRQMYCRVALQLFLFPKS